MTKHTTDITRELAAQVALVSGGGSGIGRATCLALARAGATVVVVDIDPETSHYTCAEIVAAGGQAQAVALDVTDAASVARCVEGVLSSRQQIDLLVNNAGGAVTFTAAHECPEEDWDKTLALNLKSVYLMSRAVLPDMMRRRRGVVVNMSSLVGLVGVANMAAYAASKGGIIALTRQMACDYGPHGIRVNAVAPGPTLTPPLVRSLTPEKHRARTKEQPLQRLGEPEDIAAAVVFLASDRAAWISGTVLPVDGGKTAI